MNQIKHFIGSGIIACFMIIVLGASALALEQLLIYSDKGLIENTDIWVRHAEETADDPTTEGIKSFKAFSNYEWSGWGVFTTSGPINMSQFQSGYLRFWVKSAVNLKIEVEDDVSGKSTLFLSQMGWVQENTWQEITVPFSSFAGLDLSQVISPFIASYSHYNQTYYIDFIQYLDANESTLSNIRVLPRTAATAVGEPKQLFTVGYDTSGAVLNITNPLPTWSLVTGSGNLNPNGNTAIFTGTSASLATVRAEVGILEAESEINVNVNTGSITYLIYTDADVSGGSRKLFPEAPPKGPMVIDIADPSAPEGQKSVETEIGTEGWGGWWSEFSQTRDLAVYESGKVLLYVKSPVDLAIKLKGGGIESLERYVSNYG
ncbi:MAG: hypothetical protein GF384_09280, partial [Elusimicrobia bacterium]|nr:hypothetical protein [Elusimicrobiota bacterium]MBD3412774.1 hypothetical protein [Elusimicrobiota bacterium]